MKKNTIATAIVSAAAFIIFAVQPITAFAAIPVEDAKIIATGNAGVKEEDATLTQEESETINGIELYNISFQNGAKEYYYQLNASTGEVLYHDTIVH